MWSIFGVKINYIVIFEESCNSSTLLMKLFKIRGHMNAQLRNDTDTLNMRWETMQKVL